MKPLKLNWAYTPYLRSHNDSCGYDSYLTFDCFVDKAAFELIKPEWAGYIEKNGKRIGAYRIGVLDTLEEAGYPLTLDGVEIKGTVGKNNLTDYVLSLSQNSTNDWVSYLANFRNQLAKWNEQSQDTVKELKGLFAGYEREDSVRSIHHSYPNAQWTKFRVGEHEFAIDLKNGLSQSVTYDEPSHEYFVPVKLYARLKNMDDLDKLANLVETARALPRKPAFNENQKWQAGYDSNKWEPKRSGYRY